MATKSDFMQAQERIFARPRQHSRSDQELLRKTEDDGVYPSSLNVKAIRVDRITTSDRALRAYSDASLDELGQSLLTYGQLIPILVQYDGDNDVFVLVDGERRWQAAQRAGIAALHAVILGRMTPAERYERQVAAALQQNDWDPGQRAQALEAYKMLKGIETWAGVAAQLGVSEATLQALLSTPAPADAHAPDVSAAPDAAGSIDAALRLLDHALASLPADSASAGELLAALSTRLSALKLRVQKESARLRATAPTTSGDKPAKPVRRIPTWRAG